MGNTQEIAMAAMTHSLGSRALDHIYLTVAQGIGEADGPDEIIRLVWVAIGQSAVLKQNRDPSVRLAGSLHIKCA